MLVALPNEHPDCACAHTRSRHCALSLWGGGAARALATRARCAALVGVAPCTVRGHCTSKKLLSFGARPCFDVPAAASNAKQAARLAWRRCHCTLSLLEGDAERVLVARARRVAWVCGRSMHYTRPLHQREACLLRCTAVLRRDNRKLQRQACAVSRVVQAPLRCLSFGRRPSMRGWRSARVVVAPRTIHGLCTS